MPTRLYTTTLQALTGPQVLDLQNAFRVADAVDTLGDYDAGGGLVEAHAVLPCLLHVNKDTDLGILRVATLDRALLILAQTLAT